ncbi:uncharacterized protein P174DRAFT_37495 [Aspergillus novofumigatus IBT 16806]|uniref:Uncharacterized protein n=1 Tax=Aspergillus novofumigatus (strain IBT 16806) TaxID=1392255 RepID=A0A2I1CN56_ASPN1|nr:uncharacterized protein P174DRAFT_37495 [Aspergillus novofumigatus IBT 16806]PKX99060.1 hypothetical protein P174DRAFT_37495 [Aspergillus novofumigatus IBT 16806]
MVCLFLNIHSDSSCHPMHGSPLALSFSILRQGEHQQFHTEELSQDLNRLWTRHEAMRSSQIGSSFGNIRSLASEQERYSHQRLCYGYCMVWLLLLLRKRYLPT